MDDNAKTIINVAGDYVQQKTVENEIGNVEQGGVGIQINHYHHGESPVRIPQEKNYNEVRKYVEERMRQDKLFKGYWNSHTWKEKADFLSDIFGWEVDHDCIRINCSRNN
ncbi:MAG: hypothetical protein ACI3Z5_06680 [Paludibacteraceae bacterium]|nr:hypothetical protein [Bacteroidales bacterium]